MIYDIIDNVVSDDINDYLLGILGHHDCSWNIGGAEPLNDSTSGMGMGMISTSYRRNSEVNKSDVNTILNSLGSFILNSSLRKSSWQFFNVNIDRIYWNYYYPNSGVQIHQDLPSAVFSADDLYISMVYHLNTNKGYNTVCGEKIDTIAGRCILFQTTDFHEAVNPIDSQDRFTMNVVFSYDGTRICKKPIDTNTDL